MTELKREVGGWGGLGDRRYERYVDAFDWVEKCLGEGYYLEAIAVLDSLINDRLNSRLGYVTKTEIDSWLTCGQLCRDLVGKGGKNTGAEKDADFRTAITDIQNWVKMRNEAMHATAKILRDEEGQPFTAILQQHRQAAVDGIRCLRAFDELDTADRARVNKHPASAPNAFFPERRLSPASLQEASVS